MRALLDHGLRSAVQSEGLFEQVRFRIGIGATLLAEQQVEPATEMLQEAVAGAQESLWLGVMAFAVVVGFGVPVGVTAAVRRGGWWDRE